MLKSQLLARSRVDHANTQRRGVGGVDGWTMPNDGISTNHERQTFLGQHMLIKFLSNPVITIQTPSIY